MDHTPAPSPALEVSDKVAASILRADRSKASVANEVGIPATTWNRKINGHIEFTFSELLRIARALGVKPSAFTPTVFVPDSLVAQDAA